MSKAKTGGKGVAALEKSPSHLLHRAVQLALDHYADEFGPGSITQRQYAVMAAAATHEGATQTDLVRITGIDRSTLADMAARMIAKGLLERRRSASDARANSVSLTEAGLAALEDARPKMAAADSKLMKRLAGGGRRDDFLAALRDLVKPVEPAPAADGPPRKKDKKPKAPGRTKKKARKQASAMVGEV